MTEYTGVIPGGGAATVTSPNSARQRLLYQNQGANVMRFSASAAASATVGLAVPGNMYGTPA